MDATTRKRLLWLGIGALAFGLFQAGSLPLSPLSASVSQALLQRSWSEPAPAVADCRRSSCSVARLSIPGQRAARIILRQTGDRAPAGGWGHLAGTPLPGAPGNTVFRVYAPADGALLQRLRRGDTLVVELPDARQFAYRVTVARVADRRAIHVDYDSDTRDAGLILISHQPGDRSGEIRLVVNAELLPTPRMASAYPQVHPLVTRLARSAPPA